MFRDSLVPTPLAWVGAPLDHVAESSIQPGLEPLKNEASTPALVKKPTLDKDPRRACDPMEKEVNAGGGLLAELVTLWETHTGAVFCSRTAPYGRDSC